MPSLLAWLDHDEAERRRMQEVIELFRERDTVDELGIGSIRDAFSNLLFPGTSVLHSRARYFLFIPWIYLELEWQRVSSGQIAARARRDETRLNGRAVSVVHPVQAVQTCTLLTGTRAGKRSCPDSGGADNGARDHPKVHRAEDEAPRSSGVWKLVRPRAPLPVAFCGDR